MLNIISHQRCTNQNHNEIALYAHEGGHIKETDNDKEWWGCGENRNPLINCSQDHKWCSCFGKQFGCSLQKLNTELPNDPAVPLWYILKTTENICPYKNLYTKFNSRVIQNSSKVETIQMSINYEGEKQNAVYP